MMRLLWCFLAAVLPDAALAQSSGRPDLIVLVQPFGDVSAIVCTYSRPVPHREARQRVERLAALTGGKLQGLRIEDVEPQAESSAPSPRRGAVKQTGVECLLAQARLTLDRAFNLQPFFAAFGDVGAFEVLFFVRRLNDFRGLRSYEADGVSVRLVQDGAPYRYRFDVDPSSAAGVTLPAYQPPSDEPAPVRKATNAGRFQDLGPLIWGIVAGMVVFVAMLVRGRFRAARPQSVPITVTGSQESRKGNTRDIA